MRGRCAADSTLQRAKIGEARTARVGAAEAHAGSSCEHTFVTSQGSPYSRFRRALASGSSTIAWAAAAELETVTLADALALCLLVVPDRDRYARAATRWHARFCAELPRVSLAESQLVLAALAALGDSLAAPAAADALADLCERRGVPAVAAVLEEWTGPHA